MLGPGESNMGELLQAGNLAARDLSLLAYAQHMANTARCDSARTMFATYVRQEWKRLTAPSGVFFNVAMAWTCSAPDRVSPVPAEFQGMAGSPWAAACLKIIKTKGIRVARGPVRRSRSRRSRG